MASCSQTWGSAGCQSWQEGGAARPAASGAPPAPGSADPRSLSRPFPRLYSGGGGCAETCAGRRGPAPRAIAGSPPMAPAGARPARTSAQRRAGPCPARWVRAVPGDLRLPRPYLLPAALHLADKESKPSWEWAGRCGVLPIPGVHPSKRVLGMSSPASTTSAEAEPRWRPGAAVRRSGGTGRLGAGGGSAWCRGAARQPPPAEQRARRSAGSCATCWCRGYSCLRAAGRHTPASFN